VPSNGSSRDSAAERLWAITSYFNPFGYKSRLANFRTFQSRLSVPLIAVELSYDNRFELTAGDADVLVSLRSRDVIWQKERLLNVALQHVPDRCEAVAWLDCDIIFQNKDWARESLAAIEDHPMLQPFTELIDIPSGTPPPDGASPSPAKAAGHRVLTLSSKVVRGTWTPEDLVVEPRLSHTNAGALRGLAWVARKEVLLQHGIYDASILGSGDRLMANAALGHPKLILDFIDANEREVEHFLKWAGPFHDTVQGRLGCVDGTLLHLNHGDVDLRNYTAWHRGLRRYDFDPFQDITHDDNGCWRWNSDKKDLHGYIQEFLKSKREDDK